MRRPIKVNLYVRYFIDRKDAKLKGVRKHGKSSLSPLVQPLHRNWIMHKEIILACPRGTWETDPELPGFLGTHLGLHPFDRMPLTKIVPRL